MSTVATTKSKRWLIGVPEEIERDMMRSARAIVGSGYTPDYYATIASEFTWLYEAGKRDAKKGKGNK